MEPDNFKFEFIKEVKKIMDEEGIDYIDLYNLLDNKYIYE